MADAASARGRAWDCGTGSGQAAVGLAERFGTVVATDASPTQIREAPAHSRIVYAVSIAERSPLASRCVDLVVVAQALHWFDRPAFFREVRRVLVGRGAIAVWCYGRARVDAAIDPPIERLYDRTLGPYWPAARELVENGYRDVEFPFEEIAAPRLAVERSMTLEAFAGYVGTWSATRRFRRATRTDPVPELVRAIERHWGDAERIVRWPLSVRMGRVATSSSRRGA